MFIIYDKTNSLPMMNVNIIKIFYILDEFCKYLSLELKKHQISVPREVCRNRPALMSDSEIVLIPEGTKSTCQVADQ